MTLLIFEGTESWSVQNGLITFKALNGSALSYVSDLLTPHIPSRALRSSNAALSVVPKSRLNPKNKGDRAFAERALRHWNNLPEEIRMAKSVSSCKSLLKKLFYSAALL